MKNNIFRLLVLTLSVLMLLSLSLVALTGCDDDETDETAAATTASTETATEADTSNETEAPTGTEVETETSTEPSTETSTETETEAETETETEAETETETEAPADDLLANVDNKLTASLMGVANKFQQDLQEGKFSFSMPLNAKVAMTGHFEAKTTFMGMTQTTEMTITASVTVAEGGLAIYLNVPNMATVSIVCTDRTVYLLSEVGGLGSDKTKITIDDEMLAELIAYINGSAEGGESDSELEQIKDLLTPIANAKPEDIISSITYDVQDDGNITITFKGIKDTFVATLNTILGQLDTILSGDEDETGIPEISTGSASEIVELLKGIDWSGFEVSMTVDQDAQILKGTFAMSLSMNETVEDMGDMTIVYAMTFIVEVTRGGQTVTAPADADSYVEMDMSGSADDEVLNEILAGDYFFIDVDGSCYYHERATDTEYQMDEEGHVLDNDGNIIEKDLSGVTAYVYMDEDGNIGYFFLDEDMIA